VSADPIPLLFNASAAKGRSTAWLERLRAIPSVEVHISSDPGDMEARARMAAAEGRNRVLVAGGDGSLHYAARGLAGSDCALGIIPTGTGNDMARSLGIELDPLKAAERALGAKPRRIDLGSVERQLYLGVAGIGFDGEVNKFVNEMQRGFGGPLAYPYALLRTLWRFRAPKLRIEHDGGTFEGRAMMAALANSPCFGGGMRIAPEAVMDDGLLDLVIVEEIPRLLLLALFPRVYRGSHVKHPSVHYLRVSRARVGADRPLTFFADGEALTSLPAEGAAIDTRPRSLLVVA
jgi:YegS/Rv2252/BmrU family lipid kinase